MQAIAKEVPVNIIVTTGWYTLYELPYYFHYREHFPEMWTFSKRTELICPEWSSGTWIAPTPILRSASFWSYWKEEPF